jgi:hypothetical protein
MGVPEPGEDENQRHRSLVHVEGDDLPLQRHPRLCAGVVYFRDKWKRLCDLVNQIESCGSDSERDDAQFKVIHAAQEFVSLVFNPKEPDQEIHVTNIIRISDLNDLWRNHASCGTKNSRFTYR